MRNLRDQIVTELLDAYRRGLFPMADPGSGNVYLCDSKRRGIMPLSLDGGLIVPSRLARTIRSGRFRVTTDRAFGDVIRGCAAPRKASTPSVSRDTWIDDRIIYAFSVLFEEGHAHSVEAWRDTPEHGEVLVGGLYGLQIGGLFAAESMFCQPARGGRDASKVCLIHALRHCARRGVMLFDTQFRNPHLGQFGCHEIPRADYHRRLGRALEIEVAWQPFDPDETARELAELARDR
ncbi:MAG: leucyl/phenylalanyl-tRNA--protein transferase [Phycisphaeraceae bacterium]|nr:leucyl/phenylalanyl-tRNA--protein transferase [Phycisphaeraceae bacterium]